MADYARAPSNLPPNIDLTRSSIAYGDRAFPKINRELGEGDLLTQQRALCSLCDLVRNPQNVKLAIDSGVLSTLQGLLTHADDTVRLKTTEVFFHISSHAIGRKAIVTSGCLVPLSAVFDDKVVNIRLNAHGAVERSTRPPLSGADELVSNKVVPKLVEKIRKDDDSVKVVALGTLSNVLPINVVTSVDAQAVPALIELLSHSSPAITEKAAHAIMLINFAAEAKDLAVAGGAVAPLVALLASPVAATRAAAAGALMCLTNSRSGKEAALSANAPDALMAILNDADDSVKLNVIKAITTLTEHPAARTAFAAAVPQLEAFASHSGSGFDSQAIARCAGLAVAGITWKP